MNMNNTFVYDIDNYLLDLVDLGYSKGEILDIIKVGDIKLSDEQMKILNKTKRGKRKFADYVLYHKPNIPLAIVEAKDNNKPVGGGILTVDLKRNSH